eukprot:gene17462-20072_t
MEAGPAETKKKRNRNTAFDYEVDGKNQRCCIKDLETAFITRNDDSNVTCKREGCKFPHYKQRVDKGLSNVKSHLNVYHKEEWQKVLFESVNKGLEHQGQQKVTTVFVPSIIPSGLSKKAVELYAWLNLIVKKNAPFSIIEDEDYRIFRGSKMNFSRRHLRKVMDEIGMKIQEKIRAMLPKSFGIIHDGWAAGKGTHLMAIFVTFPDSKAVHGRCRRLISVTPLDDETSFTAESIADTVNSKLWDGLGINNELTKNISFVTADNAAVNYKLARLLDVPMIGCYSHRLNLCCKSIFQKYDDLIVKYSKIMDKIANCDIIMGRLRAENLKNPVQRNVTRWSSTFEFIERTLELFDHFTTLFVDDREVKVSIMMADKDSLKNLYELLKPFQILTKKLQLDNEKFPTIAYARKCFKRLFDDPKNRELLGANTDQLFPGQYLLPSYDGGLAEHSRVNLSFQSGIEKVQSKNECDLNDEEKAKISVFLDTKKSVTTIIDSEDDEFEVIRVSMDRSNDNSYLPLDWIDCTSNVCERLFSRARLVLHYLRKRMTPASIEILLYLFVNRDLWDVNTIHEILNKTRVEDLEAAEDPMTAEVTDFAEFFQLTKDFD